MCKAFKLILHYNIEQPNTMSGFLEFAPARFGQGPNVKNTTLWKISKSYFSKPVPKFWLYIYICLRNAFEFMETIRWQIKCAIRVFFYCFCLLLGSLSVILFCYPSCVVSGWTNRSSFATCRKTCLAHEIICVWLCSVLFCLVGCRFARFGYFVCYFGFVVFSGFSVCAGLYKHTVSVIWFV